MSDTAIDRSDPRFASASSQTYLRARIGWICHALRVAAVVWIVWAWVVSVMAWSDKTHILHSYELLFSANVGGVSASRYAVAFAAVIVSLTAATVVVVCLWRLFGTYLAGRVFTVDAAVWLRRTGLAGLAAVIVDVLVRAVVASILVGQFVPIPSRSYYYYALPQDLLHLIFALFVFALAYIFKAAAEMAEEQAQIV
jgi:hypothetical protein